MAQFDITLDGSPHQVEEGTTGTELFESRKDVVALRIDGELRDLAHVLADGDVVEPVTAAEQDGREADAEHEEAQVAAPAPTRRVRLHDTRRCRRSLPCSPAQFRLTAIGCPNPPIASERGLDQSKFTLVCVRLPVSVNTDVNWKGAWALLRLRKMIRPLLRLM